MSSLADLPEVVGFFSNSRDDDEDFGHQLSSLRDAIQKELAAALGRKINRDFRRFRSCESDANDRSSHHRLAPPADQLPSLSGDQI